MDAEMNNIRACARGIVEKEIILFIAFIEGIYPREVNRAEHTKIAFNFENRLLTNDRRFDIIAQNKYFVQFREEKEGYFYYGRLYTGL